MKTENVKVKEFC